MVLANVKQSISGTYHAIQVRLGILVTLRWSFSLKVATVRPSRSVKMCYGKPM